MLDKVIDGTNTFHEQDPDVKKAFYTRDKKNRVRFESNYDLYQSRAASWRDTLNKFMRTSDQIDPDEIPTACRCVVSSTFLNNDL